ncbi:eEF1A lysine and N-terminal methyltransferase-like [Pleuronectes platessa]|uniref:eEF1A lysine and N-terminal methyltransferase-like n=1 Tax=Pleuronectes platessa TaxID=8262 RepID=UPI00232A174A|nr:eEF1A lysine and N-terminal methyltransferase-like [Pleuronectes platessa]
MRRKEASISFQLITHLLSEQIYDVGYKHLTNIDISETVVTHMNQRNAERRPGLTFQQVDATQTLYEDACYQAALDKGTLDAMASEEEGALARNMLIEVGCVLSVRGRYVCVTLAQESVIKLAVEHFVQLGWAVRLHCLQGDSGKEEDSFSLPVFVLVCTKFRQPMPIPILEMCLGEDGAPTRLTQVSELLSAVREHQAYSVLRKKLQFLCDSFFPLLIMSVPQGSETAWLYCSSEGQKQLAASANFRRLVIVAMHRNQEYTDMQAVQAELSPMVMDLAPPGMPANQQTAQSESEAQRGSTQGGQGGNVSTGTLKSFICKNGRSGENRTGVYPHWLHWLLTHIPGENRFEYRSGGICALWRVGGARTAPGAAEGSLHPSSSVSAPLSVLRASVTAAGFPAMKPQ